MKLIILAILLLVSTAAIAAPGDVLYQCDFNTAGVPTDLTTTCGMAVGTAINSYATIETSGGHDGGKYINYYYAAIPADGYEVVQNLLTPSMNQQEVTIEYWEKFDVDPSVSTIWNVKSVRPYVGSGGDNYTAALVTRWAQSLIYGSPMYGTTLTPTSSVNYVRLDSGVNDYCDVAGEAYYCPHTHFALGWTPGQDTSWHKYSLYIKVPSSDTATDGVNKLWIDGVLIYSITNQPKSVNWDSWSPTVKAISFHPSDAFFTGGDATWTAMRVPFHHAYDDIKVYEGYVPPEEIPQNAGTSSLSPLPGRYATRQTVTVTTTGSTVLTCAGAVPCTPATAYTAPVPVYPGSYLCTSTDGGAAVCGQYGWPQGCVGAP